MSIGNINSSRTPTYQYTNRSQKSSEKASFTEQLQNAGAGQAKADDYLKYLESRFGKVTVQSIGKDRAGLNSAYQSMGSNDVIIAPGILEEMASNPEKAAEYERRIQDYFDGIQERTDSYAEKGFTYEPGGMIIHEDGTITHGDALKVDRDFWSVKSQTVPSFVKAAYNREEFLRHIDDQMKANTGKKMTIREMLTARPHAEEMMYRMVGSSKLLTFDEYVWEMERQLRAAGEK